MRDLECQLPANVPIGTLTGFLGYYCAELAYKTNNPIAAGTSAILLYTTAEIANNLFDGGKPLCLKAASGIKRGLSRLRI